MSKNNLEIERKFLIEYPNFELIKYRSKVEISQSYLIRVNPNVERRIRAWIQDNSAKYYYTEKMFLTGFTRQEVEREISKTEYDKLSLEIDSSIVTVEKVRYLLDYNHLTFEIDVYPFSKVLAIMEVELESETQQYTIPKDIKVLKEVTGIKEFGNIPLCTARTFPV